VTLLQNSHANFIELNLRVILFAFPFPTPTHHFVFSSFFELNEMQDSFY